MVASASGGRGGSIDGGTKQKRSRNDRRPHPPNSTVSTSTSTSTCCYRLLPRTLIRSLSTFQLFLFVAAMMLITTMFTIFQSTVTTTTTTTILLPPPSASASASAAATPDQRQENTHQLPKQEHYLRHNDDATEDTDKEEEETGEGGSSAVALDNHDTINSDNNSHNSNDNELNGNSNRKSNRNRTVYGSACLLIKDDNTRLIEWLAYHYTMFPLRYLIVGVDPDSATSPKVILQRWTDFNTRRRTSSHGSTTNSNNATATTTTINHGTNDNNNNNNTNNTHNDEHDADLQYLVWTDNDYMDPITILARDAAKDGLHWELDDATDLYSTRPIPNSTIQAKVGNYIHDQRQREFLSNCYRHHKLMGRSWVMHIDTDEYVLFNGIPSAPTAPAATVSKTASSFNNTTTSMNDEPTMDENRKPLQPKLSRKVLPKVGDNTTIIDVLMNDGRQQIGACVGMIRLLFGDKIDSNSSLRVSDGGDVTTAETTVDRYFDVNRFDTLRYLYHHKKGLYEPKPERRHSNMDALPRHTRPLILNGLGKVLVDVSRMSYSQMDSKRLFSIHRPFLEECPSDWMGPRAYVNSILRVNHYLGSWTAYNSRIDSRRSRAIFDKKAKTTYGPSYEIRPWLQQFINDVGIHHAQRLFEGIGGVNSSSNSGTTNGIDVGGGQQQQSSIDDKANAGANVKNEEPETANEGGLSTISSSSESKSCALLFFGLGRKFKEKVYPSVKKYILDENPNCDVFVHTYDVNKAKGNREGEDNGDSGSRIHSEELLLLFTEDDVVDNTRIVFETESDFANKVKYKKYRNYFPEPSAWEYPTSMDNMIRQWHSIESVWTLLRLKETKNHNRYDRVGLFRPDVVYTHPITIINNNSSNTTQKEERAVIPSMMYKCTKWCGYNDRMFYGDRMYGELWANHRFDNVDTYLRYQQTKKDIGDSYYNKLDLSGLHSEDYMRFLLTEKYPTIPLTVKDICFQRVRSNGLILEGDCNIMHGIHNTDNSEREEKYINVRRDYKYEDNDDDNGSKKEHRPVINVAKLLPVFDDDEDNAPGVIVLGMHRSGTSMLTGLLSEVFHWIVPGDQVYAEISSQNPLGFFENKDITRQNDAWLKEQDMAWDKLSMYTDELNSSIVHGGFEFQYQDVSSIKIDHHGKNALLVYNKKENRPWAMKDPRACLTLPMWLPLLSSELDEEKGAHAPSPPPILFIYRNPMDVARSLGARKRNPVPLLAGFKLWIWYNREAIRLSDGMCRIVTSNDILLTDPTNELRRIENGMKECGLRPIHAPNYTKVGEFINIDFQHKNSTKMVDNNSNIESCDVPSYESFNPNSTLFERFVLEQETNFYHKAMVVFCDMKSGKAFIDDYIWPVIPRDQTDELLMLLQRGKNKKK